MWRGLRHGQLTSETTTRQQEQITELGLVYKDGVADLSGYSVDEMTLADTCCARAVLSVDACDKQVSGNIETIAEYSGRGPTLDGRNKPEITAMAGLTQDDHVGRLIDHRRIRRQEWNQHGSALSSWSHCSASRTALTSTRTQSKDYCRKPPDQTNWT